MKTNLKSLIAVLSVLLLVSLSSCKKLSSFDYPEESVSAYELIKQDLNYSIFRYAIERAGLIDVLNGKDQYTVFLPTNGAFINAGYPQAFLTTMPIPDLALLVKNHIVVGKIDVKAIGANDQKATLSGQQVLLQKLLNGSYVDGADMTTTNQSVTNGYVNTINKVIVTKATLMDAINAYSHTTANSQFSFTIAAINKANTGSTNFTNLLSGTNAYTFFLPNNGAWIDAGYATVAAVSAASPAVLETILKNQLIDGAKFTTQIDSTSSNAISGIKIYFDKSKPSRTTNSYANGILFGNGNPSNIKANNGIIHTVSRLMPTPVAMSSLDYIKADANLSLFAAMLKRASAADPAVNYETLLSDALKSYTVFAVNNAGIIAAGYPDITSINAEKADVIANIIKYHLIFRRLNNINYAENATAPTLLKVKNSTGVEGNASLTFLITGGFKIKGSGNVITLPVITGNVITTNGAVNIMGNLLQP